MAKSRGACANRSIKPVAPTGETAIGGDRGASASGRRWRRHLGRPGYMIDEGERTKAKGTDVMLPLLWPPGPPGPYISCCGW